MFITDTNSKLLSKEFTKELSSRYVAFKIRPFVYKEILYMGYSISVFNNNGKEIDFLAQKNNKKYFVQVAYSVAEEKHIIVSFRYLLT